MEDFPTRLADLLETVATKVRSMTVDRAQKAIKIVSLALPVAVLAGFAAVFLFMTMYKALAIPLGAAAAYGILFGLFLLPGAFVWAKRRQAPEDGS